MPSGIKDAAASAAVNDPAESSVSPVLSVCRPAAISARTLFTYVAECTSVEHTAVSIKGKTAEKLGALGRGDGIAAQAVVLLARDAAR